MNAETVVGVVTRLYTAVGRRVEEVDFATWAEVLADLTNDEAAEEATLLIIRNSERLATPRAFRETYQAVLRRRQDARSLPAAPEPDLTPGEKESVMAGMAELKRQLRGHPAEPVANG